MKRWGIMIVCRHLVLSVTDLPGFCTAEVMIEILSHRIYQDWVLYPAMGKSVPYQTDPPRTSIHTLTDAIVWVCAWAMSIGLLESCLDLCRAEFQAHSFSLLTVLFSNRSPNPQQGIFYIPQHPAQWSSHYCCRDKTTKKSSCLADLLCLQGTRMLPRSCLIFEDYTFQLTWICH